MRNKLKTIRSLCSAPSFQAQKKYKGPNLYLVKTSPTNYFIYQVEYIQNDCDAKSIDKYFHYAKWYKIEAGNKYYICEGCDDIFTTSKLTILNNSHKKITGCFQVIPRIQIPKVTYMTNIQIIHEMNDYDIFFEAFSCENSLKTGNVTGPRRYHLSDETYFNLGKIKFTIHRYNHPDAVQLLGELFAQNS